MVIFHSFLLTFTRGYPPSLEIPPKLSWARSNVPRSARVSRAWLTRGARSRLLGWHGKLTTWDGINPHPGSSNMFLAGKSPKKRRFDGKRMGKTSTNGGCSAATVDSWRVSSRVSSIATFDYQSITKGVNDSMDFRGNRHRFQSVPWFSDVPLNQFWGTGPTSFTNQKAGGWTRWIRETDGKGQTYQRSLLTQESCQNHRWIPNDIMQTLTNTNQQQPVGFWASQKDTPVHEQPEVEVMPFFCPFFAPSSSTATATDTPLQHWRLC